jgi:quercetin dioxygenase-like cupin family protein
MVATTEDTEGGEREMISTPASTAARTTLNRLTIEEIPWEPYRDRDGIAQDGVFQKIVFELPGAKGYAGLFKLEASAELLTHVHRTFEHHAWIVSGGCVAGEHYLREGSYEYVPPGANHGIDRAGPDGCTLFYLFLRT